MTSPQPPQGAAARVSAFAVAMIAVTIWIFNTDRLLTGSTKKGLSSTVLSILAGKRRPLR